MKIFNKQPEDVFVKLDKLMSDMASPEIYIEYLKERAGM